MVKYIKLPINTPEARAIQEVLKNKQVFIERFRELAPKYGWQDSLRYQDDLCGIEGVIFEKDFKIDTDFYKKVPRFSQGYTLKLKKAPKEKREAQKKLIEDWHSLHSLSISRDNIDRCIGKIKVNFNWAGFAVMDDFILFELGDPDNYDLPEECIEITYSEWKALSDTGNK